jgi:hypothetical protein
MPYLSQNKTIERIKEVNGYFLYHANAKQGPDACRSYRVGKQEKEVPTTFWSW